MVLSGEEIRNALKKTLPKLTNQEIDKAARSILEASGQWREVDLKDKLGAGLSVQCRDICAIGDAFSKNMQIRVFIKE